LPVIFVCENNQYGMSGSVNDMTNISNIAERSAAYGIPGSVVDGNDIFDVMQAIDKAVSFAREGNGPRLVECKTYRWKGESKSDAKEYRHPEAEKKRRDRRPIRVLKTT